MHTDNDNKEMHKNEHSDELSRFRNRIAVWSSLHELALIYGSSHGSVFESPIYRVHNEHESGSPVAGFESHRTGPKYCSTQPTHTYKYKYTLNILLSTPTHTCTPTYMHIYIYVYIYIIHHIYIHLYILIIYSFMHTSM